MRRFGKISPAGSRFFHEFPGKASFFPPFVLRFYGCSICEGGSLVKNPIFKITLKAMLVDGLFWAGYCSFSSFIVPYLQNIGFSENAASAVMTAIATVSFLVQPLTGRLCDTRFSQKQVYLTLSACAIPLLILLPLAAGSVPLTLLIIFGLTLAVYQVPGLVDSWIRRIKKEYLALNYGIPRGTGSISFAAAAQVMGVVTVRYGHSARLLLGAGLLACSMIAALRIHQEKPVPAETAGQNAVTGKAAFSLLLKNRTYLLLLCVTFLAMIGAACFSSYMPMMVSRLGGDSDVVGSCFAVSALCEVPPMLLMNRISKKVPAKYLILFASFCYIFRVALHIVAPTVGWLIAIQVLQGPSFAVFWAAAVNYINDIVDENVKATAVMTFTSVGLGVSYIAGTALGTVILPFAGVVGLFAVCTGLTTLGFLLALLGFAKKWWR